MAKERNKTSKDDDGAPSKGEYVSGSESGSQTGSESEDESKRSEGSRQSRRNRSKRKRSSRSSSRKSREDEEDSHTSSSESESYSDSYSDSESGSSEEYSETEEERRRRKRRERKKREEREKEKKRRRRKEKEKKRRRKERDVKEDKKRKKIKEKKKRRDKEKGKKGAVTDSWGKYGIIRETDMWNKRPEFTAWLAEVKKVNLESLPNWEEKQMFKDFMEDHNTATFPSKKYYDLDGYHRRQMEKEMKKGFRNVPERERTIFNDEEQRRQELLLARERQKEEQVEALKRSMQSGMAQAMKEQAQLREEMAYQYKIGNFEAAAAIQRRLDPDVAM